MHTSDTYNSAIEGNALGSYDSGDISSEGPYYFTWTGTLSPGDTVHYYYHGTVAYPVAIHYDGYYDAGGGTDLPAFSDNFGDYYLLGTSNSTSTPYPITQANWPVAACYHRGTHILTPGGECVIEDLAIGDSVVTASGETRAIKWIGRRSYAAAFARDNRPVKITAGALGNNIPARDLYVSPCHAMLVDGILIRANLLLNGTTITQPQTGEAIHYLHIELDSHDAILAEGAASETYFGEASTRGRYENAAEFAALYPGHIQDPAARFCAPRLYHGFEIEAVRDRINARAGITDTAPQRRAG